MRRKVRTINTPELRPMHSRILAAGVIGLIAAGPVLASTYTGSVVELQIQASSSGGTRVGVKVSGTTACTSSGGSWYAFEFSDNNGPGKAWLAALLSAKATGETVTIAGTGTCDPFNVETVSYINSL